ncbi:MAG: hypothetical protein WA813_06700 [Beijerinckiaceae bacterium]
MRKAWLLLVPLAVGGCQSLRSAAFSTTVPIDQERRVARYFTLNEDCSSRGFAVVRIVNQPSHGTVSVREGRDYPNFVQSNPRNICNKQSAPATLVFYRPAPGLVGIDSVDLDVIYASGGSGQNHFNITVK